MLFRRSAYEAIGGHSAVAGEVVEDLALARRIKQSGRRLVYQLGLDAVELQMYDDFPTLWEGWSKNWYLGLDRNVIKALSAGAVVFTMFTLPWLLLGSGLGLLLLLGPSPALWSGAMAGAVGVLLQWLLRLWISVRFDVPLTFWWLMGVGGLIVAAIAPTSVWRSETGRGWTWKGRPPGLTSDHGRFQCRHFMRCSSGFNGVRIRFEVANPVLVSLLALVLLFVVGEEQLGLISEIGLSPAAKLHFQKRQALLDRVQARSSRLARPFVMAIRTASCRSMFWSRAVRRRAFFSCLDS